MPCAEALELLYYVKVIEPIEPPRKIKVKKESKVMKNIRAIKPPVSWVKAQLLKAGDKFGSVWFYKREDATLRKLCYKLHVAKPKYVAAPRQEGLGKVKSIKRKDGMEVLTFSKHKVMAENNNLLTVFDVNYVQRDKDGKVTGKRGGYRSVPLENVVRIFAGGELVEIEL